MRLDKYLSQAGKGTRKEVKLKIRKRFVTVNGNLQTDPGHHVCIKSDKVQYNGMDVTYRPFVYLMLNKPSGYVSATKDNYQQTVLELISGYEHYQLFPVGRLDKDTEGLLILTNDGPLAHEILSPRKHVEKKYFVRLDGQLETGDIESFKRGIVLSDGYKSRPATLIPIKESGCEAEVLVTEGKYHQVKRMFKAIGKTVLYLERKAMGGLKLDENLKRGSFRELTSFELELLCDRKKK